MDTTPEDLYCGLLGGIVCGARTIVDSFRDAGLGIEDIVLTGGLPHAIPELGQVPHSCEK